mgnify:CR=1 FL=1
MAAPLAMATGLLKPDKLIKGLGRASTGPSPPEAPPAPGTETTAVQQAASEAARRRSRSRGARSTILSQSFLSPDTPALKESFGS